MLQGRKRGLLGCGGPLSLERCAVYNVRLTKGLDSVGGRQERREDSPAPRLSPILGVFDSMRFVLIDRILDVQPGQSLVAVKNLTLAEEYLADHFPGFPVMPGVLMLEALTQAGAWLIRETEDFAHSVIVLKQAKTIKYGSFVEPGRQLQLRVEVVEHGERETLLKGKGVIDDQTMVQGRFTLSRYNLRERDPALHATDAALVAWLRDLYATLRKGSVGARAMYRNVPAEARAAVLAPGRGTT